MQTRPADPRAHSLSAYLALTFASSFAAPHRMEQAPSTLRRGQAPALHAPGTLPLRSMFDVQCSMFNVRCSMFDVQCSMFNVRIRAPPRPAKEERRTRVRLSQKHNPQRQPPLTATTQQTQRSKRSQQHRGGLRDDGDGYEVSSWHSATKSAR